jgi:3,4-dihydroxy 2-butanone 4-phosphate synthase/GTP cyclohydrolase II
MAKANLKIVQDSKTSGVQLSPIDEVLEELRQGRMVVVVDDEDRENEGDLIMPAATITPEAINFMTKFGRGLICMPITESRVKELQLPMMPRRHVGPDSTAFTTSIEAREGVTTGISAAERAHTIKTAIDPKMGPDDIITPGHIFPLVAKEGGVLVRAGHTEATIDLARLAGFAPAGVLCEILHEDGSMARLPDLLGFCGQHTLKIASIADLIAYRLQTETLVERLQKTTMTSAYGGEFTMINYRNRLTNIEHVALIKGSLDQLKGDKPAMVRMHRYNMADDLFGDIANEKAGQLQDAMRAIGEAGRVRPA